MVGSGGHDAPQPPLLHWCPARPQPSEHQFEAAADALGIANGDAVVVYDRSGIFSAPRAWWTWHVFGHRE